MKKIYIFAAVIALLTLSLNAQYSQNATKQKQVQRVEKSKDTGKAADVRVYDLMSGTKDAPANAVSVPYYNHMTTDDEFGQLATYDANGDANGNYGKWGFYYTDDTQTDVYARYIYNSSGAADDYLIIAVPVILQAGKHYRFSMDVATGGYTEKYEVVMFDELSSTSITSGTQIIPVTSTSSSTVTRVQSEQFTVSQESYKYFAVHCVSDADMYYLQIDNLAIEADDSDDLSVAISAPESVHAGETATVTATVTNIGSDAVQGYTVNITANGNVIFTQTVASSLAAGASATYTAQYPATSADAGQNVSFGVEVVYTDDDPSNNTAAASMYVLPTPPPVNVAATADGNSGTMTWETPNIPLVPGTTIWDFEEEADFTAFTTIDADGDSYNWYRHENTGSGNYTTNSGNGVLASESYHNTSSSGGVVLTPDNWLISPEVTLGGTLTLYAAHQATYPENFAVYVCAGPYSGVSSFTKVYGDITTTADMTKHTIDLSAYEGQGYIAIRHYSSSDNFILLIDDIAVEAMVPGEQPTSYNVYLEGQLMGYVDANTFTYTFNNLSDGTYNCAVSAVYPGGYESAAVPTSFTISTTTTNPTIAISPENQTINDANAGALTVTGTDIEGNINVSAANDWSLNPNSLGSTGGQVSVSYTGRALSANTTVTATAANDNNVTATANVNYVADLYIVTDNGVTGQWDFNNGTQMTYNDGVYTATFTATSDNTFILFARMLGNDVNWNTRYVFGPDSNGDWWLPADGNGGGNLDLGDDDPIKIQYGGTYTITINANDGTFTITSGGTTEVPVLITPVDGSTVFVGTTSAELPSVSKEIPISGQYLTKNLTATISGEGFSFLTRDIAVPYADVNAATASVIVTYSGTDENATGTLTLSSDEVSAVVNLTASYIKPVVLTTTPAGYVAQGSKVPDEITTAIIETFVDRFHGDVVSVTYVNSLGMTSDQPFDGVNIVVTRYSDGTTSTSKVIR